MRPVPAAWVFLAALVLASCGGDRRAAGSGPNVVIVLLDTTRPDHLEPYGYPEETSPFLNALADRAVVFENAVSTSSWTAPSTATLFTGHYPAEHGVVRGFWVHKEQIDQVESMGQTSTVLNHIPEAMLTLPAAFLEAGYRTFGLSTNINVGPEIGFDRGFDRFERIQGDEHRREQGSLLPYGTAWEVWLALEGWAPAIRKAEPYFLYLHFNDAHLPYVGRAPFYRPAVNPLEDRQRRYDSEIRSVDGVLSRIYELLELDQNSILVIVSDHGEAFGEHGFVGHRGGLQAELNRIALMISWPDGDLSPGRRSERVSLVDLYPTILELAGIGSSVDRGGISLVGCLQASQNEVALDLERRVVFAHRAVDEERSVWAAAQGKWKLVETRRGRIELYDVWADPQERFNVAEQHPEVVSDLLSSLLGYKERTAATRSGTTTILFDADDLQRLKSLGYIDG